MKLEYYKKSLFLSTTCPICTLTFSIFKKCFHFFPYPCKIFTHFQSYFTFSPTPILLITLIKYLFTSYPIFIYVFFCHILSTPYFIITHYFIYISYRIFIHSFKNFPPVLFASTVYPTFKPIPIPFLFFGLLPNITDTLYKKIIQFTSSIIFEDIGGI